MSILSTYWRVLQFLGGERRLALILAFANLALAAAQFAEPVLFGRIIDRLSSTEGAGRFPTFQELLPLIGAWVGFGLFSILAAVLVALHSDRLAHRRRMAVTGLYFEHVLNLPLSFHASVHSGRLLKTMLDGSSGMFGLWLSFFRENCASLAALVFLLPLSLFLNWRLGSLLIVLLVLFGCLIAFVLHRTHALQQSVEQYNSSLAEQASDALGNISVIQSFTRIELEANALRQIIDHVLAAQMPVLNWWAVAAVGARASATLALLGIFLLGTWLNLRGLATIGQIVTFMNLATMLIARLEQVIGFFNTLFLQAPKMQDFFKVLDTVPRVADSPKAIDPSRLHGRVSFENVSFSYDGRKPAVSHLAFEVAAGETVALVGATGSGKSTTLGLLHRVFDPQEGRVTIDGLDIRTMSLQGLRRNIGVVFQEPMLFARSIEENLRVGKPDATPAEIALALERSQAADFVARQENGLATIVGERGRSLSGGERQRLAIARALLKDPPIMILDEATSALDATTERQLQEALETATKGRTTFIIAHRLATIREAKRIFVFDHGHIVETGSFDELVALGGRFATLAKAQFMVGARPEDPETGGKPPKPSP
ncbi:glucan ABC transporter ATP-binding protein/ permease [Beijerinckia indica]|uniref:ABC transporter related n=1 Tax=Beijerinckia indica subsp. indica (strain ATCC 9039 / DSM 1715 / NCIMB 8712) TaxID=395963 RepID=B2IDF1_BEII9|nr:glucan ABC transporter ATP-binding protein/ permease [Beijerinckia indica]ACB94003.1 ABC transporter related [Beijerinckia indica subsp. indica ATCC 9039]